VLIHFISSWQWLDTAPTSDRAYEFAEGAGGSDGDDDYPAMMRWVRKGLNMIMTRLVKQGDSPMAAMRLRGGRNNDKSRVRGNTSRGSRRKGVKPA
jgi:hypothetical protein